MPTSPPLVKSRDAKFVVGAGAAAPAGKTAPGGALFAILGTQSMATTPAAPSPSPAAAGSDPGFEYQELLPAEPHDTPYRLLTRDGVSTFEAAGRSFVNIEPGVLTRLAREAM